MPAYSLDLDGPEGTIYIPTHSFPNTMRQDDEFMYQGWTWRVLEIATKQFDVAGEPELSLRCIAV